MSSELLFPFPVRPLLLLLVVVVAVAVVLFFPVVRCNTESQTFRIFCFCRAEVAHVLKGYTKFFML